MTVRVRDLYRFKLRMFLGPLRRKPEVLLLFALLAFLTLPGAFAVGYFYPDGPFANRPLAEVGALTLSFLAGMLVLVAPGGGFLLQPVEVEFVATSPVTVRRFALADALFQSTLLGVGLVGVTLAALGYGIRTAAPVWAFLVPPAVFVLLLFVLILLGQSIGIARLRGARWATPVAVVIFAAFFLPAIVGFLLRLPRVYADLPYPTSAAIQVALLPFGEGNWIGLPVLAAYALLLVAVYAWATRVPTLPNLKGTFAFSFTPEARRSQQEVLLRAFGRFRRAEGARLYRHTIRGTMAALHAARVTRDGTLVLAIVLGAALGIPAVFTSESFAFGAVYVVTFLPVASVGQWMVSDRPNLWILSVSGASPAAFFAGWWVVLAAVTGAAGLGVTLAGGLVVGRLDGIGLAVTLGAAMTGTAGSIIAAAKLPYLPSELTLRPLLHMILTGAFAGLGVVPIFALGWGLASIPLALAPAVVATVAGMGWLSWLLVNAATKVPVV